MTNGLAGDPTAYEYVTVRVAVCAPNAGNVTVAGRPRLSKLAHTHPAEATAPVPDPYPTREPTWRPAESYTYWRTNG